jgi:hypothetical protein
MDARSSRKPYHSDLTEAQWKELEPHLPPPPGGGPAPSIRAR